MIETIINRWNGVSATGRNNIVAFKNDIWIVALLFDPYYVRQDLFHNTAFDEELEIDVVGSTRNILRKFYPLQTEAAMYEVLNI